MNPLKQLCILLTCYIGVSVAVSDWVLIKDKDNIRIYSQQNPHYPLKYFKGQTRINQAADTILAALQDTKACPEWVYNCVANDMVEMVDVRTRVYHTIINTPLWFKDRDFYLQSDVVYYPDEQLFTITLRSKPNYGQASKDTVRISDVNMIWHLKRIAENITEVTYQVYIDPKLPFKAINHRMIKRSIFKTLQGLTEMVKKPHYAETKFSAAELDILRDDG